MRTNRGRSEIASDLGHQPTRESRSEAAALQRRTAAPAETEASPSRPPRRSAEPGSDPALMRSIEPMASAILRNSTRSSAASKSSSARPRIRLYALAEGGDWPRRRGCGSRSTSSRGDYRPGPTRTKKASPASTHPSCCQFSAEDAFRPSGPGYPERRRTGRGSAPHLAGACGHDQGPADRNATDLAGSMLCTSTRCKHGAVLRRHSLSRQAGKDRGGSRGRRSRAARIAIWALFGLEPAGVAAGGRKAPTSRFGDQPARRPAQADRGPTRIQQAPGHPPTRRPTGFRRRRGP